MNSRIMSYYTQHILTMKYKNLETVKFSGKLNKKYPHTSVVNNVLGNSKSADTLQL